MLPSRVLTPILLSCVLAVACDDPAPDACAAADGGAPSAECCEADPSLPGCCEAHPDLPGCAPSCAADPAQPACRPSCDDDATQPECLAPCDEDPEAPHCEPPASDPGAAVEVVRDSLGIPHVYGATDADAMWGSGYMQAHDRLFQMDLARRRALGRQAEVLGSGKLGDDVLMRTVDIAGWADLGARRMRDERPELYALLTAWTAGVNARIDEVLAGDAPMPAGFEALGHQPERWRRMDGVAVGKLLLFGSSNQIENDLLATIIRDYLGDAVWSQIPILTPLEPTFSVPEGDRPGSTTAPITAAEPPVRRVLPPDAAERLRRFHERLAPLSGEGSNNWAMDGRFTENGRSLIAGDPHQPLRSPSLFWAHHVNSADAGGTIDVVGFNFVGAPGVHLGHNADVVWTATLNYPDMMDLWDVRVANGRVRIGAEEIELQQRVHTIEVAGGDPVELVVRRAPGHGVLLPDDLAPVPVGENGSILFNWTGFAPTDDFGTFFGFNTAASVDEFEATADRTEIGAFNWIAADRDSIGYISSMWLPERTGVSPERQPWTLLDGDDPDAYWTGDMVPRELLPRSRATERGWIATANNDPFGVTADGDPTNDAYYFGVYYDPGTRAERIHQELTRLADRGAVTPADFETLQDDTHSILADHLIPILEDAWARLDTDEALAAYRGREDLVTLHDLLVAWDRRMEREASAPVAFTGLVYFFAKLAIEDEFSLVFEPVLDAETVYLLKIPLLAAEGAWEGSEAVFQDGVPATVLGALSATASWLTATYGGVDPAGYTWAALHCTRFNAIADVEGLDGGCVPTDGGDGTINVSSDNLLSGGVAQDEHRPGGGAIYRMVATFADDGVPEARVSFPRGNVEDPTSPWFDNNLEDWVEGRHRPLPFRRADVDADTQETLTIP